MSDLEWDVDQELGAVPRPGSDLEAPAERRDALADAIEANPAPGPWSQHDVGIEAAAIVTNFELQCALGAFELEHHARGAGVTGHVVERFLSRTVDRDLDRRRQSPFGRPGNRDLDARALPDALAEKAQSRREPQVVEDHGAQLVGEAPDFVFRLMEDVDRLGETRPAVGCEVRTHAFE